MCCCEYIAKAANHVLGARAGHVPGARLDKKIFSSLQPPGK